MLLETLSDFFLFLSSDKKTITTKNLIDFDIFINKKQSVFDQVSNTPATNNISTIKTSSTSPSSLSAHLFSLLNEMLFYLYNTKVIELNSKIENQIQNKASELLKSKFSNSNGGYQEQHKKNIQLKKIKEKETKKQLITMLRNNEFNINMDPTMYISFFNSSNSKYKNVVTKFMNKMKSKENENGNVSADDKSHSDLDKSNPNNKSGLSYVSDKDGLVQNKEKFLDVLSKVKINIENENKNEVKVNDIKVEVENKEEKGQEKYIKEKDVIKEEKKESEGEGKRKKRKKDKTDGNCCIVF